jgi:hypothetical protein
MKNEVHKSIKYLRCCQKNSLLKNGIVDVEYILRDMPSITCHLLPFYKEYTGFRVNRGCRISCWSLAEIGFMDFGLNRCFSDCIDQIV